MSTRLTYLKDKGYITEDGDIRHTKVSNFCLPMFNVCVKDFNNILLNAYISNEQEPHLYIVVSNKVTDKKLINLLEDISSNSYFTESFADDDDNELVFKLKVPREFEEDYFKILNGIYSEISKDYKNVLKKYYGNTVYNLNDSPLIINGQVATTMWEILNPTVKKREIVAKHFQVDTSLVKELIDKPDLKYEIYRNIEELLDYDREK